MLEPTCVNRVTRKENSLLQMQLHVRLQIMREEYRMTKRSLEKHIEAVRNFLVCVKHTTPGLASFSHPDTRLIKSRIKLKQCAEYETLRSKNEVLPQCQLNKRQIEVGSDCGERNGKDCPKEAFTSGCSIEAFEENRDTMTTSGSVCDSWGSPKYGRDANTLEDETSRMKVLSRFGAIFDLNNLKQWDKSHINISDTTDKPLIHKQLTPAATLIESSSRKQQNKGYNSCTSENSWPARTLKRRLTWSAPPRSKLDNMEAETRTEVLHQQLESDLDLLCETDTSETLRLQQRTPTPINAPTMQVGQQVQRTLRRPKTAPPKYQLQGRTVRMSRQQMAGFQAEIRSRKTDIQAILKKSRQLRETVKLLTPEEDTAEDDV